MVESEKPEEKRRFSQKQYEMLKRCSDKKDMTEWNKWRKEHPEENIWLEGANLEKTYLEGVDLRNAKLCPDYYCEGISFIRLEENQDRFVNLKRARLRGAHLENAILNGAHLEESELVESHLEESKLIFARLKNANLFHAHLKEAMLEDAFLNGAIIERADLKKANFRAAIVDGDTTIWRPLINRWKNERNKTNKFFNNKEPYEPKQPYTDFEGVPLDSIRVDPRTKQLLEYNVRRNNWERWYKYKDWYEPYPKERNWLMKILLLSIRCFWLMSDYGLSTGRIIFTFFGLALVFANIYYHWGRIAPPGIVENLFIDQNGIVIQSWLVPLRTLYFSIVTMTTLGFGDMYANAHSVWGHILLSIQVILGYVLLGALVTRFAVLFTAGGPAGKFADEKNKATENTEKNK